MYAYTLKYWLNEYSPPQTRPGLPYALAYKLANSGYYKAQVISPKGSIEYEIKHTI